MSRRSLIPILAAIGVGIALWWRSHADNYPIANLHPRGSTIIALGDSLTAGVGAGKGNDYVSLLSQRYGVPILNKGVPGDTTEDALKRLRADVLDNDPRIVIVMLGGNDYMRRIVIEDVMSNLDQIITRIQDKGALVILVGMKSPLGQYEGYYRDLARRKRCPYVPNILSGILLNEKMKSDQIHPNDAGYALMAERIGKVLEKHVDRASSAKEEK